MVCKLHTDNNNNKKVNTYEQPTLQTNFFSIVSGHLPSHKNTEITAKMPDMCNYTATNTISTPHPLDLGVKSRASHTLGKYSSTDLCP